MAKGVVVVTLKELSVIILIFAIVFSLLLSIATGAKADGIALVGNHVAQPKTVLTLTRLQAKETRRISAQQPFRDILLSPGQIATLERHTGVTVRNLRVISLSAAREYCTCEASNVAVATDRGKIEVVRSLLGRDIKAESRLTETYLERQKNRERISFLLR